MTGSTPRFSQGSSPRPLRSAAVLALPLLLSASGTGCSLVENTIKFPAHAVESIIPGTSQTEAVDPVELQEQLLRFADNFAAATLGAANKLQRDGKPIDRAELLTIQVTLVSDVLAVATGANALGNLVDMVVLTSGARIRVQDYWLPKVYGDSALPMLAALQTRESQIWALADKVLKAPQRAELRGAIAQWRKQKSSAPGSLSAFASVGLVAEVSKAGRQKASSLPSSVFTLLDIDPLAGLDPATRELAQTRLFAERALYIGQRMPQLIEWQMELLTLRTAAIPEVRQLVENSTQLAATGDRLSRVAEQTPALLRAEREKILAAFKSQEQGLTALAREAGQTLVQGTKMADSTDQALKTFHGVVAQFQSDPTKPKEKSDSEPFRIEDYAETAAEIGRMSERLTNLLNALQPNLNPETFARLSAEADAVAARTERRGQELVDYAFKKALQLIAAGAAIVLASGLAFRFIGGRMARTGVSASGPSG
jgi:hypothetical protein